MLLCLLHAACGLALAAPPQFARLERADLTLDVRALPAGVVSLEFERRDADGRLAERRAMLLHPAQAAGQLAVLRLEARAVVIGWLRAGDADGARPSEMGDAIRVTFEGEGVELKRLQNYTPRGAGEHPGVIVCPAGGDAAAQVRDPFGLARGAAEAPGRIECPAGPGWVQAEAARQAAEQTAERKPGRLVHPPGLPE